MKGSKLFKILLCAILVPNILLVGCYKPIANTSDEFDNDDDSESTEITDDSSTDTSNSNTILPPSKNTDSPDDTMNKPIAKEPKRVTGFRNNLSEHLSKHGQTIQDIADESNPVESRILREYGAVFLTQATPPSKVMFTSDSEVNQFQSKAGTSNVNIGGFNVELQAVAAKALKDADSEARQTGLSITPRDPKDSGKRSYAHTFTLWNGRFEKGCSHWLKKGKMTEQKVSELRSMPIKKQVAAVLELERQGIYFSTNFDKSILYSVAAPGTSQHISMLAFDAKEFGNRAVRRILAKHGWYRTVKSDAPHFTYLGYPEGELPGLGLKKVASGGGFWVPNT